MREKLKKRNQKLLFAVGIVLSILALVWFIQETPLG